MHSGALTDPSVVAVLVAEVPRIVVACVDLFPLRNARDHPAALADLPWVAFSTFYRHQLMLHSDHGETEQIDIRPRLFTDSLYAFRHSVLQGAGVASKWVVADDIASGRLLHLCSQWRAEPLPVYLVCPWADIILPNCVNFWR
ncbi:LysR substrate-binding domain-containing protein [Erwinia psidii]|uniref:LysR substrate-binding domain-containing protein n=1 Tax=Erwinia psidii TaxID=69224 RepID=UPI001F350E72|nr:LysR substrate-binding domain-containing protein [Erwinia psidii]